jgi:SAM-dependent methyltransferase
MQETLIEIVGQLCADAGVSAPQANAESRLARPADAFRWAGELARKTLAVLPPAGPHLTVAQQGARVLMDFLAHPPPALLSSIAEQAVSPASAARAWDEPTAGAYEGVCSTVQDIWEHSLGPEASEDATIAARALDASPGRALDFGAGAGHCTTVLAQQGWQVDALEVDAVKRAFLARRLQATGIDARVRLVDAPGTAYDLVLAINVLDHVQHPLPLLQALIAALGHPARLLLLAAFPDDGWHHGIDDSVLDCGELLMRALHLHDQFHAGAPSLQEWISAGPTPVAEPARPRLRRQTHLKAMPGETPTTLLSSPLFFARACMLSEDGARLAADMDGAHDIDALASRHGLTAADVRAFADALSRQHLAFWE